MLKTITRTFKLFTVTIKDAMTGEVITQEVHDKLPKREKIAIAFIKETGRTNFTIEIIGTEEMREMSVNTFMEYSTLVVPKVMPKA